MKRIYLIIASCLIGSFAIAQTSFTLKTEDGITDITNSEVTVELTEDDMSNPFLDKEYKVLFTNNLSTSKNINVKREILSAVSGVDQLLCWQICHGPGQNISIPVQINAGETVNRFVAHYKPYQNFGTSSYLFTFFDVDNSADSVTLKINFTTGTLGFNKYENAKRISVYPNPASENVFVNLEGIYAKNKEVRITNMLGSVVKTVNPGKQENIVNLNTSDIPSGVYFALVIADGKVEANKKIIIKH